MSLAIVHSRAVLGVQAPPVRVEVHLGGGLPAFTIVGLPETAVRESKERVRGAIANCNIDLPRRNVVVNLAPADLPKEGGRYDLAIAVGLLLAAGTLDASAAERVEGLEFLGELALNGELRGVRGALPAALASMAAGRALVVPTASAAEAALARSARVLGTAHLTEVLAYLAGREALEPAEAGQASCPAAYPDLADVRGQPTARRALEVAAAGGHNLLMVGPPGTGKTMLANRLPGILPPLDEQQAVEAAMVHSISHGGFDAGRWGQRPFRAPHHTASAVALVGGGAHPRPGELSLAHHGVLFLDELPEFDRRVLEVLREPLESGRVSISRAAYKVELPARVQLVAAMNPCPCGYLGDGGERCSCTPAQVARYRGRVSGPLLDRIDLHVEVPQLKLRTVHESPPGEDSAAVRERVLAARQRQLRRAGCVNAALAGEVLPQLCPLQAADARVLYAAAERLDLSARACHRVLRMARTLADLDDSEPIGRQHLLEAIAYRVLDRGQ